jgi:hypothetical protein
MNDYTLNGHTSAWLNQILANPKTAYIRIHLNHHHITPFLRKDFYVKIAKRFQHNYTRHFVKGCRRTGYKVKMVVHRHLEQGRLTESTSSITPTVKWDEKQKRNVRHLPYLGKKRNRRYDAPHLHILAEIPADTTIDDVNQFVFRFCNTPRKDYWPDRWGNDKWIMDTMRTYYVAEARTMIGSSIYNGREGDESLLQIL